MENILMRSGTFSKTLNQTIFGVSDVLYIVGLYQLLQEVNCMTTCV